MYREPKSPLRFCRLSVRPFACPKEPKISLIATQEKTPKKTYRCSWHTKLSGAPSQSSSAYFPVSPTGSSSPSPNKSRASCVWLTPRVRRGATRVHKNPRRAEHRVRYEQRPALRRGHLLPAVLDRHRVVVRPRIRVRVHRVALLPPVLRSVIHLLHSRSRGRTVALRARLLHERVARRNLLHLRPVHIAPPQRARVLALLRALHRIARRAHPQVPAEPRLAAVEARRVGLTRRDAFRAAQVLEVRARAVCEATVVRLRGVNDMRAGLAAEHLERKVLCVTQRALVVARGYGIGLRGRLGLGGTGRPQYRACAIC